MTRSKDEIMENFLDLACALSPENLSCDGEASSEQIESTLKSLNKTWAKLEDEIGYKVTEEDAWDFHRQNKEPKPQFKTEPISEVKKKKNFFGV